MGSERAGFVLPKTKRSSRKEGGKGGFRRQLVWSRSQEQKRVKRGGWLATWRLREARITHKLLWPGTGPGADCGKKN